MDLGSNEFFECGGALSTYDTNNTVNDMKNQPITDNIQLELEYTNYKHNK